MGGAQPAPAPTPLSAPAVCNVGVWPISSGAGQLAVAAEPDQLQTTIVAANGAGLRAFEVGERMSLLGAPGGAAVALPGSFTQVAASSIDHHTIIGAVGGDGVELALIDDPAAPQVTATLPGSMVAQPLVLAGTDTKYVVTADDDTVWMTMIDRHFNPVKTMVMGYADDTITSLAAVQARDQAITAYSTSTSCYVTSVRAVAGVGGQTQHLPYPCAGVTLASDGGGVTMAFEQGGEIETMPITSELNRTKPAGLQLAAHAPHMVFADGQYWVSYLTANGGTSVGYVVGDHLESISVDDEPGGNGALELIAGNPWSVSLDPIALAAHQLCIPL